MVREIPELPEWVMPPQMVGGHVTGSALIERSEHVLVAVRQVLAYPTGVEIEVEGHARGGESAQPPEEPAPFGHESLRFRLRLADGREAIQDDDTGLRSGRGPMLVVSRGESGSGGPDNREHVRLTLWMWPLPPPGPLTLSCSWPGRGLADAGLVLDGDAIRAAAQQAVWFWPEKG